MAKVWAFVFDMSKARSELKAINREDVLADTLTVDTLKKLAIKFGALQKPKPTSRRAASDSDEEMPDLEEEDERLDQLRDLDEEEEEEEEATAKPKKPSITHRRCTIAVLLFALTSPNCSYKTTTQAKSCCC